MTLHRMPCGIISFLRVIHHPLFVHDSPRIVGHTVNGHGLDHHWNLTNSFEEPAHRSIIITQCVIALCLYLDGSAWCTFHYTLSYVFTVPYIQFSRIKYLFLKGKRWWGKLTPLYISSLLSKKLSLKSKKVFIFLNFLVFCIKKQHRQADLSLPVLLFSNKGFYV